MRCIRSVKICYNRIILKFILNIQLLKLLYITNYNKDSATKFIIYLLNICI